MLAAVQSKVRSKKRKTLGDVSNKRPKKASVGAVQYQIIDARLVVGHAACRRPTAYTLGVSFVPYSFPRSVADPQRLCLTTTMTEDTSIPPSRTLTCRLRSLIANLDATSVESTAKQVCEWIDSAKDHDDRFRGLLRLSAELVLEKAMERPNQDFHHVLGRFCKILDTATDGESSIFLNSLWKQEIQAAGVELLENDMAEAGTWPEYLALVIFAGELCNEALLQPEPLRSCASMLSGSGSNLGLELACAFFEATGCALREDHDGKQCFDTAIQAILTASAGDGISGRIQHRVQVGLQGLRYRSS